MPQVTFVLKEPTSKEETLVYLLYRFNGAKLKYSTGQKITPKYWNPENQRAREVRAFKYGEFNALLNNLEAEVNDAYRKLINDRKKPTPDLLRVALNIYLEKDTSSGSKDLISFAKYIVESTDRSKGTKKQLGQAIRNLEEFKVASKRSMHFDSVDLEFYDEFVDFLLKKNYGKNTIGLRWLELNDKSSIYDLKLEPFKFAIPSSEYKAVNDWIIDNYLELAWGTLEEKKKNYLTFDHLIEDFQKRFKERPEKRTIRREIDFVQDSFGTAEIPWGSRSIKWDSNTAFNASKKSFSNFIQKDEEPDFSQVVPNVSYVLSLRNGIILGQYYHYLEDLFEPPRKVQSKQKDIGLTVQEQVLMLQYLGLFEKINAHKTDTDKAIFLSALLCRHPQSFREIYNEGIYKIINKNERLKIKEIEKSLAKIHQLLVLVNLKEEASIVKAELDSL